LDPSSSATLLHCYHLGPFTVSPGLRWFAWFLKAHTAEEFTVFLVFLLRANFTFKFFSSSSFQECL